MLILARCYVYRGLDFDIIRFVTCGEIWREVLIRGNAAPVRDTFEKWKAGKLSHDSFLFRIITIL